jgi:hypothetical protein
MKKNIVSLVVVFVTGIVCGQGTLTPPGAPSETMKTLQQVEPRIDIATVAGNASYHHVITSSGSYYLSDNLITTKISGIYVGASNVTIDLNGFSISKALGTGAGVFVTSLSDGLTIRNGSFSGFSNAIHFNPDPYLSSGGVVENLSISKAAGYCVYGGISMRISDCTFYNNTGSYALLVNNGCEISDCVAYSNVVIGVIYCGTGATISDSILYDNKSTTEIHVGEGGSVVRCNVNNSQTTRGIRIGNGSKVSGCTVTRNEAVYGIYTEYNTSVDRCVVSYNNGGSADSYGIYTKAGSSVTECLSAENSGTNTPSLSTHGVGIYASAATVRNCTVSYNAGDGIIAGTECNIVGNQCRSNGKGSGDGAGIHAIGSGNRIDSNNVASNDRGLDIDNIDNLLLRNSAHGNTVEYDAVLGTLAGLSFDPETAGPWDNFEF